MGATVTEYAELVAKRRLELEAVEWGNNVKDIHGFDTTTTSMWYETRPNDGRVMDIRYNDGRIEGTHCLVVERLSSSVKRKH